MTTQASNSAASKAIYFTTSFSSYVSEGDSISVELPSGFTLLATIHRDDTQDSPEERQDGFWPSLDPENAGYVGAGVSEEEFAKHLASAHHVMESWERDEWFYAGVDVRVFRSGVELVKHYEQALWGIEANYPQRDDAPNDNSYLTDTANELIDEALELAHQRIDELLAKAPTVKLAEPKPEPGIYWDLFENEVTRYISIEVHGVRDVSDPVTRETRGTEVEVDDLNPEFYSVYLRESVEAGGCVYCIGDFRTLIEANTAGMEIQQRYPQLAFELMFNHKATDAFLEYLRAGVYSTRTVYLYCENLAHEARRLMQVAEDAGKAYDTVVDLTPAPEPEPAIETTFTNVTITIALPPREAYDKLCALLAVGDLADWQTDKFKTTAYYMDEERKTSELFPVQD